VDDNRFSTSVLCHEHLHPITLAKVARRVDDGDVLHLLKITLKANGKQGVPQGGVITPLTQKVTSALNA
jgi:hypothetical protein